MPFLSGGFGQVAGTPPLLRTMQQNVQWASWPTTFQTGLAGSIRPPAPGAWTPPEALGRIGANLAVMLKWMEVAQRAALPTRHRDLGVRVAVDTRTTPSTVTYHPLVAG